MTPSLTKPSSIAAHFGGLRDPRYHHSPPHRFMDIMTIAICAVICGANDWEAVAEFGRAKAAWLRTCLPLANGIPSPDTFSRVFGQLNPVEFEHRFINWVQAISSLTNGEVVAIDGKSLRGSADQSHDQRAIHLVSAWASQNRLVLGQVKVDDKSNEITAIPVLLRLLALQGCIVTIDAMGTQTAIAAQVIQQEADYALALKENQGHLYHEVVRLFADALADPTGRRIPYATAQTINKGHGRLETRQCWTISQPDYIRYLDPQGRWAGLQTVVKVESHRRVGDEQTSEVRYYLTSLAGDPKLLNQVIRTHWTIENQLHWGLDVAFREDDSRVRHGYAAENLAVVRHIALNLLKQEGSLKLGLQNKRLRAGWDNDYLLKVLSLLT